MPSPSRRRALLATVAAPALVALGAAALARRVRGAVVGARAFTDSRVEGAAFPRRLVDPAGVARVLPRPPVRIVSTYLACEENLAALVPVERVVAVSVYADDRVGLELPGRSIRRASRACAPIRSPCSRVEPDLVCVSGYNEIESVRLLAAAGLPLLRQSRIALVRRDDGGAARCWAPPLGADARAAALVGARRGRARRGRSAACAGVRAVRVLYYDPLGLHDGRGHRRRRDPDARGRPQRRRRARAARRRARSASRRCSRSSPRPSSCPATRTTPPALAALSGRPSGTGCRPSPPGRVHEVPGAWINTESHHAARGLARVARLLHPEAFPGRPESAARQSPSSAVGGGAPTPAGRPSSRSSSATGEPMR